MATQLRITRGDKLPTETVTVYSACLDFSNVTCTGHIRAHPDGYLIHQFVPTIVSGTLGTGKVQFSINGSATKSFPPINLYGDIHFYTPSFEDLTLFKFRLDVDPDTSQL